MLYVAMLPIIDQELNTRTRPAHLAYINELFLEGKVVMAGPFTDKLGGMVIYKADSMEEAKALAEKDPAVTEGARTVEVREWSPLEFPLG
ncbi:YciI family protein [Brevibacillus dissolubilis]|uniref:YciI family protein n=1 Tax=Brevibacillus dissolubilis TaxID=1844116 RepID=UPI001116D552|nr:YciI family protein [Brevibacillus dissolubilis]